MSDKREVFTVLELTTGEGTAWVKKNDGDAFAGVNLAPMITGKKGSNFSLLPVAAAGAAATDAQPSLSAIDGSGNMQFINARDEGDSVTGIDALPALVAKDPSGNFAYLRTNADGEILISNQAAGTPIFGDAIVTPVALNTETAVVTLVLTADAAYETIKAIASSTRTTKWTLKTIQDAGGTPVVNQIGSFITGSGQFSFTWKPDLWNYTAGSTGTQQVILYATQLTGDLSDFHGYLEIFEKA